MIVDCVYASFIFSCLYYADRQKSPGNSHIPGSGAFLDWNHLDNSRLRFSHVGIIHILKPFR